MKEYLKGIRFYEVQIQPTRAIGYNCLRVCTYRPYTELNNVFTEQKRSGAIINFRIIDVDTDWVIEDEAYWFPMFCVELNRDYLDLKALIEDILVGKLSGILDVDVDLVEVMNG